MVSIDLSDTCALVTGGTRGIGRSAAYHLATAGATVYVTCKWCSHDSEALEQEFRDAGVAPPVVVEADVSRDEDTDALLETIGRDHGNVDIFVSNVGFAPVIRTLEEYKKRSFFRTLEYSSWPLVEYTRRIRARFGSYPRRIVGVSSDGPDHYYTGYDFVSAAKALLEHFGRYLAAHVADHGSRVNILRFGTVRTESFDAVFGDDFFEYARRQGLAEDLVLSPDECGKAVLALCSGLMDAMNGQVVTVDYGLPFRDNLMMRYLTWKENTNAKEKEHDER